MSPHDDPPSHSSHTNFSLAVLLATLALLLLIIRQRKGKNKSALDSIPGPRQYFLGSYLNLLEVGNSKKTVQVIGRWCDRFGPITKIGLGPFVAVGLSSPHYIQKLLGSMDLAHLGKPDVTTKVIRPVPWCEGILNSTGETWKSRRKLIDPFFKVQTLQSWVPVFNEGGRRLVGRIQSLFEQSSNNPAVTSAAPIKSALVDNTLTTICKTVLGIDLDTTKYRTQDFVAGTHRFLEIATARSIRPWLGFEPLFNLTSASRELRQFFDLSSKFLLQLAEDQQQQQQQQLQEGGSNNNNNKSLLWELIQAGLPNEGIYEESFTMIVAGYEASAGALQTLLFLLALHPQIQEKCQREVDQVFQQSRHDDDHDDNDPSITNISMSNLKNLKYLEQCLWESLRIAPLVSFSVRELEAPLELDDELELPSGTSVFVPLKTIHMNPEIYPEPQRFDPDRMAPERRKERHSYSYLPFGGGPRKCIGSKFATICRSSSWSLTFSSISRFGQAIGLKRSCGS